MVCEASVVSVDSQHFLAGHRDYKWMKNCIYFLKRTRHKAEWKVLPEATLWIHLGGKKGTFFAFCVCVSPIIHTLAAFKPVFQCRSTCVTLHFCCPLSGIRIQNEGRAERWREEECEEVGLTKPLYLVFMQCSAELCGVGKKNKKQTKNKIAVGHFRSLSISRFFKSSRKRKKKAVFYRAENIAITQQQWAPRLRNFQSPQLSNTKLTQTDCSLPMISYKPPLLMK